MNIIHPRSFSYFLNLNKLRTKQFHLSCGKYVRKITKRSVAGNQNSQAYKDFYGIESEEDVIHFEGKTSNSAENYDFTNANSTNNVEKHIKVRFGTVRLDSDNIPKFHGQFDPNFVSDSDINSFQSDQYLFESNNDSKNLPENSTNHNQSLIHDNSNIESSEKTVKNSFSKMEQDAFKADNRKNNFIDEQYFPKQSLSETIINKSNIQVKSENYDNTLNKTYTGKHFKKLDSLIHDSPSYLIENKVVNYEPNKSEKKNVIEDQYFNNCSSTLNGADGMESSISYHREEKSSLFDEQYFEDLMGDDLNHKQDSLTSVESCPSFVPLNEKSIDPYPKEVIDEKYVTNKFPYQVKKTEVSTKFSHRQMSQEDKVLTEEKPEITYKSNNIPFINATDNIPKFAKNVKTSNKIQTSFENEMPKFDSEKPNSKKEYLQNDNKNEEKTSSGVTETAFDYVNKLRSERINIRPKIKGGKILPSEAKFDSKGFRILSNQVPNLSHFTREEIMSVLKHSVLYSDDDILVLNKPYNMVMHDSQTTSDPCLSQYLDELAMELDRESESPKLITVHRLDKETCGCLLLARNEKAAQRVLSLFAQRKIVKTYWIVTINVPDPLEGVIDIPIAEGKIENKTRMVLHPNLSKDVNYENHSKRGKRAVTSYKTIATSGNAALVEVQPETGIKHQIRVHFGFGLSCPVLGDHKYSHLTKMAPQKLPSDILQRLTVRQSKVRHVPMHIYARSICIPQYREGRSLFVHAPMPIHMSVNLQSLKFKKN